MNQGLTLSELQALAVFLLTLAGAVGGVWWRIHASISKAADEARAARAVMQARIEEVRSKSAHELAEFKLEVTREYASIETLNGVEERVVDAITRLGDRFDRYFESAPRSPARRTSNK